MTRTHVLSVHKLRRTARRKERDVQVMLNSPGLRAMLAAESIPTWARGVRVEKAGPFQWAVVATETQGH